MASPLRPSRGIGGRPKERERQAFSSPGHPLRQPRQLAERVEFPEKNVGFCHSRAPFGGRGSDRPKLYPLFKHFGQWTAFLKSFGNNDLDHQPDNNELQHRRGSHCSSVQGGAHAFARLLQIEETAFEDLILAAGHVALHPSDQGRRDLPSDADADSEVGGFRFPKLKWSMKKCREIILGFPSFSADGPMDREGTSEAGQLSVLRQRLP